MKYSEAEQLKKEIAQYHSAYEQWRDKCNRARAMKTEPPEQTEEIKTYLDGIARLAPAVRREWQYGALHVSIFDKYDSRSAAFRPVFMVTLPGGGDIEGFPGTLSDVAKDFRKALKARKVFDQWINNQIEGLPQ